MQLHITSALWLSLSLQKEYIMSQEGERGVKDKQGQRLFYNNLCNKCYSFRYLF